MRKQTIYMYIATGPLTKMTGMSKMISTVIMHCGQKLRNLSHDSGSIIDDPVAFFAVSHFPHVLPTVLLTRM